MNIYSRSELSTSMVLSKSENTKYNLTFPTLCMGFLFNHYTVIVNKRDLNTLLDFIDKSDTQIQYNLNLSFIFAFDKTNTIVESLRLLSYSPIENDIQINGVTYLMEDEDFVEITFEQYKTVEQERKMYD